MNGGLINVTGADANGIQNSGICYLNGGEIVVAAREARGVIVYGTAYLTTNEDGELACKIVVKYGYGIGYFGGISIDGGDPVRAEEGNGDEEMIAKLKALVTVEPDESLAENEYFHAYAVETPGY